MSIGTNDDDDDKWDLVDEDFIDVVPTSDVVDTLSREFEREGICPVEEKAEKKNPTPEQRLRMLERRLGEIERVLADVQQQQLLATTH